MLSRSRRPTSLLALALALSLLLPALPPLTAQAAGTLIGRWAFEEGSGATAADSSGNGRTGALVGPPVWGAMVPPSTAALSYSLGFDGADGVRVANDGAFDGTSLTVAGWIRPGPDPFELGYSPVLFSLRDPDAGSNGTRWSVYLSQDYASIGVDNGDTGSAIPVEIPARQWLHVAVVFNSASSWSLYVNGALAGSASYSMNTAATGRPLNIGYSGSGAGFDGLMDDVRLYNGALSAAEVARLAQTCAALTRVVSNGNDSGAGSLRQAIADSCDGGTITFAGDYTIPLASQLQLTKSLTIDATGRSVTLNGNLAANSGVDGNIFWVDAAASVTLRRLTLTQGRGRNGGAIYSNGTLTIEDSTISSSRALGNYDKGGAIYNNGTLTITRSTLSNNMAGSGLYSASGGAIYSNSGTSLSISASTIQNNNAMFGGGIHSLGKLTIASSTIANNTAFHQGGGVYHTSGTALVTGSTFSGNQVYESGAGIYTIAASIMVANSTFSGNDASQYGGGIFNTSGPLTLRNSTLSGNRGPNGGGGIRNLSSLDMRNTIIANSVAGGDCSSGSLTTNLNNLVEDGSCSPSGSGDPLLAPLGGYGGSTQTFALLPGSAAIDAGDSAACSASPVSAVDQRGVARPSACDIGAFESGGFTLAITGGGGQQTLTNTAFAAPLALLLTPKSAGEPVGPGGSVTFTAPASGASLSSTTQTASTSAGGTASLSASANGLTGSYAVSAATSGGNTVSFSLANCALASSVVTSSADSGAGSLRQAIVDTCDGGTITFAPAVDGVPIYLNSTLTLARPLTIDGSSRSVIISGDSGNDGSRNVRPFTVENSGSATISSIAVVSGTASAGGAIHNAGTLSLSDLILTDNVAQSGGGGAIYNSGTLALADSSLSGNVATNWIGGAIFSTNGLTLTGSLLSGNSSTSGAGAIGIQTGAAYVGNSSFEDNAAPFGGAIQTFAGSTLTIVDGSFSRNRATAGSGGAISANAQTTIANSSFAGNTATSGGGAILSTSGTLTLTGSTLSGNSATTGGGLRRSGTGPATIGNSTFSGNSATGEGGAIYSLSSTTILTLTNSTLSGNVAPSGGGVQIGASTTLHMRNTIIANSSSGGDCGYAGTLASNLNNLVEDGSCAPALSGDPLLAPLSSYGGSTQTFALLPGSVAIDAGNSASCAASPVGGLDQRGRTRPAACDLGAFESGGFSIAITGGSNQIAAPSTAFATPLAVQVTAKSAGEPVGPGGSITFTAPNAGASLSSPAQTASTSGGGAASLSAAANGIEGSYTVSAGGAGIATSASFSLANNSPRTLSVQKSGNGSGTVSSSPAGIDCGADCAEDFMGGTVVTLTATPASNSNFASWGAPCSGTGSCTVTMSQAHTVAASFTLKTYQLAVQRSGSGTVTSAPQGIRCGMDPAHTYCDTTFSHGTRVQLTATPTQGWSFSGWAGCDGAGNECGWFMTAPRTVTATFSLNHYDLAVAKDGGGSGTVSSSPAGIDCGADCVESLGYGSVITLTATAAEGSTFAGWSGACSGTDSCVVTITETTSVTATFSTLNSYELRVQLGGSGSGTISSSANDIFCGMDCLGTYTHGSVVTLTATPQAGSSFSGWGGACGGAGTCVITMTGAMTVTGDFTRDGYLLLVVPSGDGTVTSSPSGISCAGGSQPCLALFAVGAQVTLTAAPAAGHLFAGWNDACAGTSQTCVVIMDANKATAARFVPTASTTYLPQIDR